MLEQIFSFVTQPALFPALFVVALLARSFGGIGVGHFFFGVLLAFVGLTLNVVGLIHAHRGTSSLLATGLPLLSLLAFWIAVIQIKFAIGWMKGDRPSDMKDVS
jgi:hypothetical protein